MILNKIKYVFDPLLNRKLVKKIKHMCDIGALEVLKISLAVLFHTF